MRGVGVRGQEAVFSEVRQHNTGPSHHLQDWEISVSIKFIAYTAAVAVVGTIAFAGEASARDQIHVAGSSTVLPYANIVAEQFGKTYSNFKTPIVESGGSSAERSWASCRNSGMCWSQTCDLSRRSGCSPVRIPRRCTSAISLPWKLALDLDYVCKHDLLDDVFRLLSPQAYLRYGTSQDRCWGPASRVIR